MQGSENIKNIMPFGHVANVIELSDGRIFVTWYCGSYEGAEDQKLAGAVQKIDGKWRPTKTVIDRFEFEGEEWIPETGVPIQRADGEIRIYFWALPVKNGFELLDNPSYLRISGGGSLGANTRAETLHFKTPVFSRNISSSRLFFSILDDSFLPSGVKPFWPGKGYIFMGSALKLNNGKWILPYDSWGHADSPNHSHFFILDENLENWETRGDVFADPGCAEPGVVQLPSGDVLSYMRRRKKDGHIWRAVSADECKNFSGPDQTNLRNPDSGVDIKLSKTSGKLLLAYNDSYRQRVPLCIGISDDEGSTWKVRDVESDLGIFAYPKLLQSQDGLWHLFYSYDYRYIQHVWFSENWLDKGRKVIG